MIIAAAPALAMIKTNSAPRMSVMANSLRFVLRLNSMVSRPLSVNQLWRCIVYNENGKRRFDILEKGFLW